MITTSRRHKHPSSGANRPSDDGETVNIIALFNLKGVNPIIECFSRDLVVECCLGLDSRGVNTAPPFFVGTLPGHSNRSLGRVSLHMHAQVTITTFLTSNIYIRLCLHKSLSLTQLWSYEMFEVLLIVRINNSMGLWGILKFRLQMDMFPYWQAIAIPLKEGVWYHPQSKVQTPPPHFR